MREEEVLILIKGSKYPPEVIKAMEERAFLKRVVSINSWHTGRVLREGADGTRRLRPNVYRYRRK